MKSIICDRCGLSEENADKKNLAMMEDVPARYRGVTELSIEFSAGFFTRRYDLCPSCKQSLDVVIQHFMNEKKGSR